MRIHTLVAAAGLLCAGTDLHTDYKTPRTLRVSSELEIDLDQTMEMLIDGQAPEESGPGGSSSSLVRKCVHLDRFLAGDADGPTKLERSFEILREESSAAFGEEQRSDERELPLQGVKLGLERNAEGAVQIEHLEGPKPSEEACLEGHALALALDAFLPEGAVESGEAWDLDDAACKRALATALAAQLFPEEPRPERGERPERGSGERRGGGRGRGGAARLLPNLAWSGTAKLAALEEEYEGETCAKITIELSGSGTLPEPSFGGRGRGFAWESSPRAAALEGTVEAELEGALYVSLERRRPVALQLDGELSSESRSEREREGRVFSTHSTQSGQMTLTLTVQEVE